ncbi:MAG: glycosyltransferase [Duncaniella sp.]|nr:glycosyltransferase [Duncaniella sp.]
MEKNLKISVVTVCYNAVDTLEETMLSVLNQTYPHVEYIVIDGGSTDGTVDIIKKYSDRLAHWVSEPDSGIYDAMNKGIRAATGDYINFMNAGDKFYNDNVITRILNYNCNADFLVGIAQYRKVNGKRIRYWTPIHKHFEFSEIKNGHAVNHQSSFIRRSLLTSGYDINYRIIADDLFFIKSVVFEGATYQPLNIIVAIYDGFGISNNINTQRKIEAERIHFYTQHNPLNILPVYRDKRRPKIFKILKSWFFRIYNQLLPRTIK